MNERLSKALETINGVVVPLELNSCHNLKQAIKDKDGRETIRQLMAAFRNNHEYNRLQAIVNLWIQLYKTDWFVYPFPN